MQKIRPCLWFDTQAEEAANFYVSVFQNGKVDQIAHYNEAGPGPKGSVMTVSFEIEGQSFLALNAGPVFKFNEAISLLVDCRTQQEVDRYWDLLLDGGAPSHCGWLKDRYGLFWQITPRILLDIVAGPDQAKAERVMRAMFDMIKLDIAALLRAAEG